MDFDLLLYENIRENFLKDISKEKIGELTDYIANEILDTASNKYEGYKLLSYEYLDENPYL